MKFQKVLIANRGAIAVRIAQAVQEMGMKAVAVHSTPDADAPHVRTCDEAYHIPGETAAETYLDQAKLIAIAESCGAQAIHPGYGFLSENASFAKLVRDSGLEFIGPGHDAIEFMGSKTRAREKMAKAGVPIVPGYQGDDCSIARLTKEAKRIGYPVLVKAAAGGGGKGMKVVRSESELAELVESAKREALKAFSDDTIFLEKYFDSPHHIEVQVIGDKHGNLVHVFERECSIQRRHQKIVEEAPSPFVTPEIRERICADAVAAAKAVNYFNAGTIEFLMDENHKYYFLEMNTRLQVEHSVTELTTGIDLVKTQLLVAMGEPLPFTQSDIEQRGNAIEVRIYAEDPASGFLPSTGTIAILDVPTGVQIRNDIGIAEGQTVSLFYDPLLAKLTVFGASRSNAIERMAWALSKYMLVGVRNNIQFLQAVIQEPAFREGQTDTGFIGKYLPDWKPEPPESIPDEALLLAALSEALSVEKFASMNGNGSALQSDPYTPWRGGV